MQRPRAEALAVHANGRIAAVGANSALLPLQQPATIVQDMAGAFVMPVRISKVEVVYVVDCFSSAGHHAVKKHVS